MTCVVVQAGEEQTVADMWIVGWVCWGLFVHVTWFGHHFGIRCGRQQACFWPLVVGVEKGGVIGV